jgi:hypothetical protein
VAVSASASDNEGVIWVQFTLNGVELGAPDTTAPYTINWSTLGAANGTHTLRAIARDAAGNETMSSARSVTVNNPSSGGSGGTDDTTNPSVSMTAPSAGAVVSGTVTVSASASDNVGVTSVQFTLNGANLGAADTTAPYSISWNTTTAGNGSYTLRAIAHDAAGNTRTSWGRTVTISNAVSDTSAPSVSLTSPGSGATVSGTISVSASASDNVGVASVQFTLNGVNLGAPDTTAPYAVNWSTLGAANGTHVLGAVARDAAGNARATSRSVVVNNPTSGGADTGNGGCTTPDPFVAIGGGTCWNASWLPPGMAPPSGGAAAPAPAPSPAPSSPTACTSTRPGPDWTCYSGSWLPPGMTPPAGSGSTSPTPPAPTPAPSAPSACLTPRPGSDWTCYSGSWLPPGMLPPVSAPAPSLPTTPAAPGACTTPVPGAGWICRNGGWLPPDYPGL